MVKEIIEEFRYTIKIKLDNTELNQIYDIVLPEISIPIKSIQSGQSRSRFQPRLTNIILTQYVDNDDTMLYEWFRDFARSGGGGELEMEVILTPRPDARNNRPHEIVWKYHNVVPVKYKTVYQFPEEDYNPGNTHAYFMEIVEFKFESFDREH